MLGRLLFNVINVFVIVRGYVLKIIFQRFFFKFTRVTCSYDDSDAAAAAADDDDDKLCVVCACRCFGYLYSIVPRLGLAPIALPVTTRTAAGARWNQSASQLHTCVLLSFCHGGSSHSGRDLPNGKSGASALILKNFVVKR